MVEWYYLGGDQQIGPVESQELRRLAEAGQITPETYIWKTGLQDWVPAGQVTGLFGGQSNQPPRPPQASPASRQQSRKRQQCHEVSYEIHGNDMQVVEVELDPQETVIAEAGAMSYMDDEISFEAKLGDGSNPDQGFFGKMFSGAKRAFTGESLFMTHFTNNGSGAKTVAFAAPFPGQIMAMDMAELGGQLTCQKDSFLCAALGTQVDITFSKRLGTGFFGGEGFILQTLRGDGMAFVHAGGTIIKKQIQGETLQVDTGCLVAFTPGIDYDIQRAGNIKSMIFGGEGLFLATLKGRGTVWLQTLPFSRLADRIIQHTGTGGKNQGEGSVLGGFGDLFGDR